MTVSEIYGRAASTAGVVGPTKAVGRDLATMSIAVNFVTPAANAPILKQMTEEIVGHMKSNNPKGRLVEVDEIANLVTWLASPEFSSTTGGLLYISGGRATG